MHSVVRNYIFATVLIATAGFAAKADDVQKATLPLVVYSEAGPDGPFISSGYMGNVAAVKMDEACKTNPHTGSTCLKVQYTAVDDWGGVVWQSPADDWGKKEGGWNIKGAKKLVFWARGEKGDETVSFQFGVLKGKPYSDSGTGTLDKVALTKDWKEYSFDLAGVDLSHIKTGFAWAVAGNKKQPITFYLDDIKYE